MSTPTQPTASNASTPATTTQTTATTAIPTTATYPYSAYHPSAYAAGAYGYGAYQTGVTGYGWSYPYSYLQQHNSQAAAAAAAAAAASAQAHFSRPSTVMPPITATSATTPITALPTTQYQSASSAAATTAAHAALAHRTPTFSAYTPNYARETYTGRGAGGRNKTSFRGLFTKELRNLMYGFGDDRNPANDAVNVMEEILIEYITDVCQQAAGPSRKSRLSVDDLRRALSNPADAKKLARLEELLFMQEDIKRARAQFDDNENI